MDRRQIGRSVIVSLVCLTLGFSVGCSYLRYRVDDALELGDVGLTITSTPQIGLYWNSLDVFPVGYSKIDGYFVGYGGNQLGITRHYNECMGFGYAREVIGWGNFDRDMPDSLYVDYSGVLGVVLPPWQNEPAYTPACVHFFPHLGFVGLVWNARWYEWLDFVVGFTTIDLAQDDGAKIGAWPWEPAPQWPGPGADQTTGLKADD